MEIVETIRQLLKNPEVDDRLKSPFLNEAAKCSRVQALYATILMLGLCAEAYVRLVAKRIEELDKNLIPYFGKKIYGDQVDENDNEAVPQKRNKALLEKLEKISKSGGADRLDLINLIEIFARMRLFNTNPQDVKQPFYVLNFKNLAKTRNDYAHPNWAEPGSGLIANYLEKLIGILATKVDAIRFAESRELIDYLIEQQLTTSLFVHLFPFHEFSYVAEIIFEKALISEGDERKRLLDFWFDFKVAALPSENSKIEIYFLQRLDDSVNDRIQVGPEEISYFIDWNGSKLFCDQCTSLLLDWIQDQTNSRSKEELISLKEFCKELQQEGIPESCAERLINAIAMIEEKLQENTYELNRA